MQSKAVNRAIRTTAKRILLVSSSENLSQLLELSWVSGVEPSSVIEDPSACRTVQRMEACLSINSRAGEGEVFNLHT